MSDLVVALGTPRFPNLPLDTLFGSLSLALWIVVYSPQIWENYRRKSGDGLSLGFVTIWLIGDIANLVGAALQHLLPTVIIIAAYYTVCDIILLIQYFYYSRLRRLHPDLYPPLESTSAPVAPTAPTSRPRRTSISSLNSLSTSEDEHERTALLIGRRRSRRSSQPTSTSPASASSRRERRTWGNVAAWAAGAVAVLFVIFVAVYLALGLGRVPDQDGGGDGKGPGPEPIPGEGGKEEKWNTEAQIIGWISAFMYIGARIPQVIKNKQTKCEGLSFLMFTFAVGGNIFYVLSILVPSTSHPPANYAQHILINLSWLAGSGLTIFLDAVVLGQFFHYRKDRKALKNVKGKGVAV